MNYCKCLKCKKSSKLEDFSETEEWKKGCPFCQSKKIEWKVSVPMDDDLIDMNWTTDECSQCHLPKVVDIINWEEVKASFFKKGLKSKEEVIKQYNNKDKNNCYCGNLEDGNDDNREREQNWETTQANC